MTDELKPCPFCGKHDTGIEIDSGEDYGFPVSKIKYYGMCYDCEAKTDEYFTEEEAIAAWNRRAEDENKPLTWDELVKMVGDPIWVKLCYADYQKSEWAIAIKFVETGEVYCPYLLTVFYDELDISDECAKYSICKAEIDSKKISAYRRKPEEA